MKIRLLFFATLKDRARMNRAELTLPDGATVSDLKTALATQLPDLSPALPTALVSRNHEFALADDPLADGDEVGLFPPVSGGSAPATPTDNPAARLPDHLTAIARLSDYPTTRLPDYPTTRRSFISPTTPLTLMLSSPASPCPPPARPACSPAWCAG